jgi:hypothetical protein
MGGKLQLRENLAAERRNCAHPGEICLLGGACGGLKLVHASFGTTEFEIVFQGSAFPPPPPAPGQLH